MAEEKMNFEKDRFYTGLFTIAVKVVNGKKERLLAAINSVSNIDGESAQKLSEAPSSQESLSLAVKAFMQGLEEARSKDSYIRFYGINMSNKDVYPVLVAARSIDVMECMSVTNVSFQLQGDTEQEQPPVK